MLKNKILSLVFLIFAIALILTFALLNHNLDDLLKKYLYSNLTQNNIVQKITQDQNVKNILTSHKCQFVSHIKFVPTSQMTQQALSSENEFDKILNYTLDKNCPLYLEIILFEHTDESKKVFINTQFSIKELSENVLFESSFVTSP